MRIKKFNESLIGEIDIWVVMIPHEEFPGSYLRSPAFTSEMLAIDYLMKYVNSEFEQEFEPFFENDERLFVDIDENEDWEKCQQYCKYEDFRYLILATELYKKPLI